VSLASEILADSPRRFYKMNESSGSLADLGSDNVSISTVQGTPTYGVTGGLTGSSDTAISFGEDGTNNDGHTGTGSGVASGTSNQPAFTIMCVVKVNAAAGDNQWWYAEANNGSAGPLFGFKTSGTTGRLSFWMRNANNGSNELRAPDADYRDVWRLLHVESDGTTVTYYVDGTSVNSGLASTYAVNGATTTTFNTIATSGLLRTTYGQSAMVKVQYGATFDYAIGATRVAAHYSAFTGGGGTPAVQPSLGLLGVGS
jgi:hypothetical protein